MQEAGCDQAFVVFVDEDPVHFEFVTVEEKTVGKALVGYEGCDDDKDEDDA